MPITPDRKPGESDEEGIILENRLIGDDPSVAGGLRFVNGSFRFRDSVGVYDPRSGSGMSENQHKTLRQLVHLADEGGPFEGFASGAFQEILPSADPFPTSFIWWTSAAKTHKIVELALTRNSNKTVNTEQWKAYDTDGSTVLVTVTDTLSYSGIFELSRTRVIT